MLRLTPLVCLVALAGCRPADDVRTYTVPKPKGATPSAAAPTGEAPLVYLVDVSGPADRLLGAFIPAPGGGFYSLKMSGPAATVSPQAANFRTLVESVRLTGRPADPLMYTLPAGWTSGPAKQMRLATLLTGGPELGVFPPFGGSLLENVNRWRGQVGATPVAEADLPTAAPELNRGGPSPAPTK